MILPLAPEISHNKPLMTGWNEDEYVLFTMERGDTESFKMNFDQLPLSLNQNMTQIRKKLLTHTGKPYPTLQHLIFTRLFSQSL